MSVVRLVYEPIEGTLLSLWYTSYSLFPDEAFAKCVIVYVGYE